MVLKEFQPIFRDLVIATQPRAALTGDTCRVYYETLADFSLEVVRESATELRRTSTFFPSTGEWVTVATRVLVRRGVPIAASCPCGGRGLLRMEYQSGEPFDIAICDCRAGRNYRTGGEPFVRHVLTLSADHRVAYLEDFADDDAE